MSRRYSAGSTKGTSAASPGPSRHWLTTKAVAWRTAPSAMGFRIDTLPCGWQVAEAAWPVEPTEGWLPIQPRGYLQLSDLVPCVTSTGIDIMAAEEDEPFVMSAVSTPPSKALASADHSPQDVLPASSRAALLALREEHVRLKEVNLLLREKEMKKRRELDELEHTKRQELGELEHARQTAAVELADVKENLAKGHEDLAHCQERCAKLRQKMEHCREAVATAVSSVDHLYSNTECAESEESTDTPAPSSEEQGPLLKRWPSRGRKGLTDQAVEEARAAGAVVAELLTSLGCENPADGSAGEDKYHSAQENSDTITVTKTIAEDAPLKVAARSPSCSPLQLDERCRAPLRDLNLGRTQ